MQRPRFLTGLLLGAPLAVTLVLALLVTQLSGPFTAQVGGGTGQCDVTEYNVPTQNGRPFGVTTGPDGNVWFTEFGGNKIGRITPSGAITESAVPTGNSQPFGITAGPDGNLWFTEQTGNKIGKITPSGVITEYSIPTAGRFPRGITAGPDGNLWFAEQAGGIGRITVGGVITEYALPSGGQPSIITAGTDGNLWFTVVNQDKIGKITPSGQITEYPIAGTQNNSFGITAGPDGNLWFAEAGSNKIGKITTGGTITDYTVPGTSPTPWEITSGSDGNLWFTEYSSRIGRITLSGAVTEYNTPSGGVGRGITTGSDGNLWYAAETTNKIGKFNPGSCTGGSGGGASVDLKINGQDGTITVQSGQTVTLSWTSSGVQDCNTGTSQGPAPWTANVTLPTSGSRQVTVTSSTTFGIQCSETADSNKIVQDSVGASVAGASSACLTPTTQSFDSVYSGGDFACMYDLGVNGINNPEGVLQGKIFSKYPPSAADCGSALMTDLGVATNTVSGLASEWSAGDQACIYTCPQDYALVAVIAENPSPPGSPGPDATDCNTYACRYIGAGGDVIALQSQWNQEDLACDYTCPAGYGLRGFVAENPSGPGDCNSFGSGCQRVGNQCAQSGAQSSAGSSQPPSPDVCEPVCGDGIKIPPEECDDGNTRNGDGCSDKCKKETGSSSSGGSSKSGSSTSKSASSTTTSRSSVSSASSTTSRSSGSSRSIIDDCRVLGNLCAPNAVGFRDCRAQNKACQQTSEDPCYTCVSDIICPADVCKPNGPGEKLCKAQGKTCRRLDEYPCIACDGEGICPADACAVGGQKYCELLGNNICTSKQDGICIDCTSNCRPGGCSDRGGAELCAARQQSCRDTSSGQCIECYPDTYVCSNTYKECKQGGDRYCANDGGKICEPSPNQPCIRCVTPPLCPDDACALGGTPYCAKFGDLTCSPKQGGICIDCEGDEPIVCQGSGCRDGGAKLCGNRGLGCRNTDDPATLCIACSTDPSCRDSSECERGAECRSGSCVQLCGNRRVDPGEACDGTRGCTADCRLEDNQQCTEDTECRTGLCIRNVCVPCTQPAQCQSNRCNQGECELLCGNGRIDPGETCDGGPAGSPYCTSNCLRATGAVCEEGKECQSNLCRDNACVTCRRNNECASNLCVSGACVTTCGDGRRQSNEQCDDGNRHSGDGCSRFCEIEEGVAAELLPLRLLGEVSGEIDQTSLSPEELAGIRGAATGHPAAGETGPAAVAVIAAGAAAGWSWMRRRRR